MKKSMFLFMISFLFFVNKGNSQTNEGVIIDKKPVDATESYFIVRDLHTGEVFQSIPEQAQLGIGEKTIFHKISTDSNSGPTFFVDLATTPVEIY